MAYTTIDDPSAHFQVKTYTGTGSELAITNDGNSDLQPDWIWIKNTQDGSTNHHSHNTNVGSTKTLFVNKVDVEETQAQSVKSVQSDGFTLGTWDGDNASSKSFVAFQWKGTGGSTSTVTDGTINSTAQVNTTAGFSMLNYQMSTGNDTVGHGLGVAPQVIIWKARFRDGTNGFWSFYTTEYDGSYDYFKLNVDETKNNSSLSAPTSTVFTGGGSSTTDYQYYMAWCFAPIQGFSRMGSYEGNGNANGPFIYLGFKPAWIIIKLNSNYKYWYTYDHKQNPTNQANTGLSPSNNFASNTNTNIGIDILSNGFKIRNNATTINESGSTGIYMAFAENPFVTSTGIPTTAR